MCISRVFHATLQSHKKTVTNAFNRLYKLIKHQSCHHIETSQLICSPNHLTGFYMMATSAFNELRVLSNFTMKKYIKIMETW